MTQAGPVNRRLAGDRDFRRCWFARAASLSGSIVTAVAMPVLVYRLSQSPALTALTTALNALPYLVVGLFAGAMADRWDRKRLMVTADLLNVVVVGSVPAAWWLGKLTVPHVIVAGLLVMTIFTFFDGANFGAPPVLVGRDRVGEANSAVWGFGGVLDLLLPAGVGVALAVLSTGVPPGDRRSELPRVGAGDQVGEPRDVGCPGRAAHPCGLAWSSATSARACGSYGGMPASGPTPLSKHSSQSGAPGSSRSSSPGQTAFWASARPAGDSD